MLSDADEAISLKAKNEVACFQRKGKLNGRKKSQANELQDVTWQKSMLNYFSLCSNTG